MKRETMLGYHYEATRILQIAASAPEPWPLEQIARDMDITGLHPPLRIARAALALSLGAGDWREQRAEAAQRLMDADAQTIPIGMSDVQRHYHAARKAHPAPSMSHEMPEIDRIAMDQAWRRRVSRDFHARLKRAGIAVEEGRAPGTWW